MRHYPRYGIHPVSHRHPGLMGVFGGMIDLTTAVLQGGATLVRTIVEGSVWHGCHPGYPPYYPAYWSGCHVQGHHSYYVECVPHCYPCRCSCCC